MGWRNCKTLLKTSRLPPYERNIEVWRQLWRVTERSDVIVQIVDGRNPMLFRCPDLEIYVKEVDARKQNLLLVNKADLLTVRQRTAWADWFDAMGIKYNFFSARGDVRSESVIDERTRILTVHDLELLFLRYAPDSDGHASIGLVGYPNVGKSSTINALMGAKKVSVSSTPGKTKHFQTLILSDRLNLCDCPGLVFPNFTSTKAELVVNGILPIDQLREHAGPSALVAVRIPQDYLEYIYGITIYIRPMDEGGTGVPSAEELLTAYAEARGYVKGGSGVLDESRAARYILKDYVNGKLLFVHPPPTADQDGRKFNEEHYFIPMSDNKHPRVTSGPSTGSGVDDAFFKGDQINARTKNTAPLQQGMDKKYNGREATYPHQRMVDDFGRLVVGAAVPPTKGSKKHNNAYKNRT